MKLTVNGEDVVFGNYAMFIWVVVILMLAILIYENINVIVRESERRHEAEVNAQYMTCVKDTAPEVCAKIFNRQ